MIYPFLETIYKQPKTKQKDQFLFIKGIRSADLASAMYLGTLDMLSIPPATTISLIPNWILCAARIVAAKEKIVPFFS